MEKLELVSKEQTWRGLKMELTFDELSKICQQEYEKDKYFDFNILLGGMHKALNKKVDFNYFTDWAILVSYTLQYTKCLTNPEFELLQKISWFFDGISFDEKWNRKKLLCDIAILKDYNHQYEDLINKTSTPFETDGFERILTFDHANWSTDTEVMRVIIKDNKHKEFDLQYVDENDFEYAENVNYQFVDEILFDNIFDSFYDEDNLWKENHNLEF